MEVTSHDFIRGLTIGGPLLLVALWGLWQRRRAKRNAEVSEILHRRSE